MTTRRCCPMTHRAGCVDRRLRRVCAANLHERKAAKSPLPPLENNWPPGGGWNLPSIASLS